VGKKSVKVDSTMSSAQCMDAEQFALLAGGEIAP
jgi:hypothetical protein